VNNDRHLTRVRRQKHLPQLLDVCGIIQLHIRVAEVEFEAMPQVRATRAPRDFVQRIRFEWIDATKRPQALGVLGSLIARPVGLCPDLGVLIIICPYWAAIHICD
jgi:hypothetical protein